MFKKGIDFFISVVETGSFSQAAKRHYLSQAAISQQISKLEEELNIKLFDRSKYRPGLTEAGQYYYRHVKKLTEDYKKVEKNTRLIHVKNDSKITVGITGPFENKYLPRIINEYREKHDIRFDVHIHTFENCKRMLESGSIDIAFGLTTEFAGNIKIHYETIHQSETCIVCSFKNPLSKCESINPILIRDEPVIVLSQQMGERFYDDFINSFILDGFEPNIVKEVTSLSEYFMSIKLNEGIGYTGREVVPEEEELCTVKLIGSHHHADFAVAYSEENPKENVLPFYRYIVDYFKDHKKNL